MFLDVLYLSVSAVMVGVIWIIQLVHYPTFQWVERDRFKNFSQFHTARITWIVMPCMLAELVLGTWLSLSGSLVLIASVALVVFIWLVTFLVSVPCHTKLARGYDEEVVTRLITTNWLRTVAWTAKLVLLVGYYGYITD